MSDDTYFELPAHELFGPQGEHVAALIERARRLTLDEVRTLIPVWDAEVDDFTLGTAFAIARDAAKATARAAWDAALAEARYAVPDAALRATRDAVGTLAVRDSIPTGVYETLTRAWRTVVGPIHPDDPDMRGDAP